MGNVALNKRSIRVAVAFEATDAFTGRAPLGPVSVRIVGVGQAPRIVDDRYSVFIDLPERKYEVRVEARDYQLNAPTSFNPAALKLIEAAVGLNLAPRVSYPFPPNATVLFGEISDEQDMGVAGARVEVVGGPHNGSFAITDVRGRCVLAFNTDDDSRAINLIVTKDAYENRAVTATIQKGKSVNFKAELKPIGGPNVAVLRGRVIDTTNMVVTQANISVSPWNVNAETNCDGRFLIQRSVSGNETVTLSVSQHGFTKQNLSVSAVRGAIVDTPIVMNLDTLSDTAGLAVEVVNDAGFLEDAVVEIVEKSRAAMTNSAGLARFFFNGLNSAHENVTIRVRKTAYQERTVTRAIRQGRTVRRTVRLRPK